MNGLARVNNPDAVPIKFIPIDHNITIYKKDTTNELDSTCDAVMIYDNNIIFFELKDKKRQWISKAIAQLQNTILHFMANHNIKKDTRKRAFASNRSHPNFNYGKTAAKERFKDETSGFILYITSEISI